MSRTQKRICREDGTAMVELALVLPILLFLALGILDFGKAIAYWNDANQMAGEAARFAAVDHNPGTDLSTPVTDFREWVRRQSENEELRCGEKKMGADCSTNRPANDSDYSTRRPLMVCVEFPDGTNDVGHPVRIRIGSTYDLIPWLAENVHGDPANALIPIQIKGSATMRLEHKYTGATGCLGT